VTIVARAVRAFGATGPGRAVGQGAYQAVARIAARWLMTLPDVESVYLTGSATRPSRVAPGHSDIDLVLFCDFRSRARELALRRALERRQALVNRALPLFYNLDYVDVRDVPYLRAFGTAWSIDLDQHGLRVAGSRLWDTPATRPVSELRNERLVLALRRWMNTGSLLLDPGSSRDERVRGRTASRLLSDVCAEWVGRHRLDDPQQLVAEARRRAGSGSAIAALLDQPAPSTASLLECSLEVLDAFARELTADWTETWVIDGQVDRFPDRPALTELGRRALAAGFASVVLARRGAMANDFAPIVVAPPGVSARTVVRLAAQTLADAHGLLGELAKFCRRPVFVTHGLWRALSLADPAPFTGAGLACDNWRASGVVEGPPAPSAIDRQAIVRARVVDTFTRLRAHGLRRGKMAAHVRRAITHDFRHHLVALRRALETSTIDVSWNARALEETQLLGEAERVERAWEWFGYCRAQLAPLLDERIRSRNAPPGSGRA
jgi:hypothetical protein